MSDSNDHRRADLTSEAASPTNDIRTGSHVLPPLAGIIELVVLTGVIVAADAMLPDIDISDIQPNPFWLPVLLLSLQYGTVSGVLAAATALLVTMMSGLPEAGVGENYFSYAMRVFAQPILWFGAAVLLGQFRMRQIEAKRRLTAMVVDLERQRTALAGYAQSLRARCDMLERDRASASEAGGMALLASLADIRDGTGRKPSDGNAAPEGTSQLAAAFGRTLAAAFPGARASVLALEPSGLVVVAATSGRSGARAIASAATDAEHPFYRAVVGEGRALSILQPGDEHRLAGTGLAAVPIRNAAGAVIGAVRLDAADPSALGPGTLPALGVIAAALAKRLGGTISTDAGSAAASEADDADAGTGPGIVQRGLRAVTMLTRRRTGSPDGANEAVASAAASEPTANPSKISG